MKKYIEIRSVLLSSQLRTGSIDAPSPSSAEAMTLSVDRSQFRLKSAEEYISIGGLPV